MTKLKELLTKLLIFVDNLIKSAIAFVLVLVLFILLIGLVYVFTNTTCVELAQGGAACAFENTGSIRLVQ